MDWLADPQAWTALGTLTALEIVPGIDNIVFISILASMLPCFAMAFSVFVEFLNLRLRSKRAPIRLNQPYAAPEKA